MSFSLDKPGFSTVGEDLDLVMDDPSQPISGSSSSAPSSGEASCRSCPRCHGRMSSFSVDRHTICCKCRGNDCTIDCRCDECMSWSVEEMESYVKLRKSLISKSRRNQQAPQRLHLLPNHKPHLLTLTSKSVHLLQPFLGM